MASRILNIHFEVDGAVPARVARFTEHHQLGLPAFVEIDVRYAQQIPLESWVGRVARLEYAFGEEAPKTFLGIVETATAIGSSMTTDGVHTYILRLVPRISLLSRNKDSRIFQDKDVQEIASEIFADFGVDAVEWRLTGQYPKRSYCVQYEESALAFVSRLLEDEGIYYFVEAGDDGDTVILVDDSTMAGPIEGDLVLPVRPRSSLDAEQDFCLIPTDHQRVRSGKYTLRDYNFENPPLDLTSEAEADADTDLEVYDYPGEYEEPSEGSRLAQVRLEAEQAWRNTLQVKAVCPRVQVGRKIELSDAEDLNGEYFVAKAVHRFVDSSGDDGAVALDYHVDATLIPIDVPYRTPRRTPKPIIHGPQTAVVVAMPDSPAETIHTDEQGRLKVHFHWDRHGNMDDTATYWMRVAQQQTSGSLILPRLDWEVIVEYLEGNPDRPMITGRCYNGMFMPPYALPEGKTRTAWQTASTPSSGGSNEIRFEDKAGSEEIMMHAQHDMTLATANNKKKTVGNNETSSVGVNSSLTVGANQDIKITKGNENTIGGAQSVSVGGNRNVEVNAVSAATIHGSSTTTVGGNQFEMIGNPLEALLALAAREVQKFLTAKADEALAAIQSQVQGAVDQALGPINDLTSQVESLGDNMQAIQNGDMGAIGGLVGDASGIPGAGDLARSMGGDSGGDGPAGGQLSGVVEGGNMITSVANNAVAQAGTMATNAAHSAIGSGVNAAHNALAGALGVDGADGGGSSAANTAGPEGSVSGVGGTDREKGPGHHIGLIAGSHSETVGGLKVNGVLDGINTNVAGDMTQNAGAAHVEVIIGNRAESTDADKTETALGLIVLSKGGESETVKGARTTMVGGVIVDKLKGSHSIEAGGPATFIGAFHKLEAKGAITLKCGGSEVVIDSGGITITSALTTILASKIQLPKKVTEI